MSGLKYEQCKYAQVRKVPGHGETILYCSIDGAICSKEICSLQYQSCKVLEKLKKVHQEKEIPLATDEGYQVVTA